MCDSACKFTGYCFNSPGKVADTIAFQKWPLSQQLADISYGYYCVGDNAYMLSSLMLVPFTKLELRSAAHSDYNFYLSQLRIRIEMAFGLLVNKWGIFKRALAVDFVNCGLVIKTSMKLHNFYIDKRMRDTDDIFSGSTANVVLREFNSLEECTH